MTALQGLNLFTNQLSGAIPPEIDNLTALQGLNLGGNQLSGAIPPEIGNLTALQYLQLDSNQLSGALPPEIGNLTALQYLYLYNNQLSGAIPPEIGNLTALTTLNLYYNQLSGAIPPEIGNLTALQQLNLSSNHLSGAIPPEIGNLTALQTLDLDYNQLSGAIPPQIGNLTALQHLYLNNNQLSGAIPPEIGNLTALQRLHLNFNQLSGALPAALTQLTALMYFYFSQTQLCVPPEGPVPAWLATIPNVEGTGIICPDPFTGCANVVGISENECEALVVFYNSTTGDAWTNRTGWLVTNTPCGWYGVTCTSGRVTQLNLINNHLSGAIPPEIGNLTTLQTLYLPNNQLSGAIPPEIGNLTALTNLDLRNNQLSSAIPPEIGNLTALKYLRLDNNQLSGAIPSEIGNLTALPSLDLSDNQLSGAIPPEIGNLTALEYLRLDNNQLSGAIPPEIGNLTALQMQNLYLGNNQLSGVIPAEIGNLTALRQLDLASNQLSGAIPPEIGNLAALTWLSLDNNQLSGAIPPEIGNLTALRDLDLFNNQLSGAIPPEIGNLTALTFLNLGINQLSGVIPHEIGNLAALRHLYLDNNPFSGEVSAVLTPLTLSYFTFNDTGWCIPPTGDVPTWLSTIPNLWGTGLICGEDPGSLDGAVSLSDTTPAVGVQIDLYRSLKWSQWQYLTTTHTTAAGTYEFSDLGQGLGIDYRVRFVDPTGKLAPQYYSAKPTIRTATVITITPGIPRTGIDAVLALPQPPAAGVETDTGSVGFNPDGTAQITMPRPNLSDITITRTVTCTAGAPTTVTLLLSTGPQFPMANVGGAAYQATIPAAALTGNATLSVRATCGVTTTETIIGYVTLYDPSGIVSDARTAQPIAGATVTLYQVPGWEPKTGPADNRPNTCESNLSKPAGTAWSQPAPTELGIVANPEVTVTAPKIPFQQTTAAGYYGWDVPLGCWYVMVTAEGYEPFTSPVVGIPPAVTDLDLALTPLEGEDFKVFLPLVLRQ